MQGIHRGRVNRLPCRGYGEVLINKQNSLSLIRRPLLVVPTYSQRSRLLSKFLGLYIPSESCITYDNLFCLGLT